MSRFENRKYEEIANELKISVNTVKYHIKHALALLHKELGKHLAIAMMILIESMQ
jgi:RNA polymerase sigma-70 factor (ECF subfamily)